MRTDKNKKAHLRRILGLTSSLFLMMLLVLAFPRHVEAASSIIVKEINYENETITLQLNSGDTEVFFSDYNKKTWETVPGTIIDNTITMDISWISPTKNYVMTFKGNASTNIISVSIPKQVSNFKATYNKVKGTVGFSNVGSRTIEWRKKGSTIWKTVNTSTIAKELSYLNTNGATVYFRLALVKGSMFNSGSRPSKEVSITIPKKATAPSVSIDGSLFTIAVKKGMAYRTLYSDGTASDWTTISAASNLQLKNIAKAAMYSSPPAMQSAVTFQFRTNATSASQVSKLTTLVVPIQEGPPSIDTYGISLSYTSSTTLSLQVKAASSNVPFEYTIVKKDEELNYLKATWTAITSSTAVTLGDDTAPSGSHIMVRKKSVKTSGDSEFALASVETDITGASGVTYPASPVASSLTTLITTAGLCKTSKASSYLTFALFSSTQTTVSSISFLDTYGINKGTVSLKSTVAKNTSDSDSNKKYIITTRITSTASIDSVTKELLYAKITLANGDVITSTQTAGVQLYLYPATVVNNPEDDDTNEYTKSFNRIYLSNDASDDTSFKFQLDLGTDKVPNTTAIDSYTQTQTAITSMKLDGYTLSQSNGDYSVTPGSYVDDENKTIATAIVTVNVSKFEASSLIDITDQAIPLEITLNNGEVLDEAIYITLRNTASLKDVPIAWSIMEGSLKLTTTSKVTNSDNTTTTIEEEAITYTLELSIYDSSYGVSVADVTWGGISIFRSAKISGGKATISLSNAKINALTTDSSTTNNVVITLSNGFSIKTGCKLTLLNKN